MSRALEQLMRVNDALADVSITQAGRKKLAQLHLGILMAKHNVPQELRDIVACVEDDDPAIAVHWQKVRESAADVIAKGQDGYVGDAEHMVEYCRLLVAAMTTRGLFPDDAVDTLNATADEYLVTHLRASDDYAPLISDTKARVLAGIGMDLKQGRQFDQWLQDIDVFMARCARHEYSRADATLVHGRLMTVCDRWQAETDDAAEQQLIKQVRAEFNKLRTIIDRHSLGPAHLEALEHQWRCYKFNSGIAPRIRDNQIGALQNYSISSLKVAETFCWSPHTTQAVMAASEGLPVECAPTVSALGDLAQVGRAGWWWFQDPLPVRTTGSSAEAQPVVALLWRYGLQSMPPLPDFPDTRPEPRPGLWCQTFVMSRVPLNGREQDVAIPTTAWIWHDHVPLSKLRAALEREYRRVYAKGETGFDTCGIDETVDASLAFSRFFMAAAAWLRQKIVVETHGGQGIRQAARQIQRQHDLQETPRVRIIELRRSQYVRREDAEVATDGTGRRYSVRFVVKGFWRQQWYPSRKEHAPKYIESYLKGPADAPLKAAVPTVYMVRK